MALPDGEDTEWIGTREAAEVLGVSESRVCQMAGRGELVQSQRAGDGAKKGTAWRFWRAEVEGMANLRGRARRRESRESLPGRIHEELDGNEAKAAEKTAVDNKTGRDEERVGTRLGESEAWMTPHEAARMLEVHTIRLSELMRAGLLVWKQKVRGQSGSPRLFWRESVEALRDDPAHQKRRERWRRRKKRTVVLSTGMEMPEELDWLSSQQVRTWMGISASRLYRLRKSGRIMVQRGRREGKAGSPPWEYWRADVAAMLANPHYQRKRDGYCRAEATQRRQAMAACEEANRRARGRSEFTRWLDVQVW